jgi:hypothetical protein
MEPGRFAFASAFCVKEVSIAFVRKQQMQTFSAAANVYCEQNNQRADDETNHGTRNCSCLPWRRWRDSASRRSRSHAAPSTTNATAKTSEKCAPKKKKKKKKKMKKLMKHARVIRTKQRTSERIDCETTSSSVAGERPRTASDTTRRFASSCTCPARGGESIASK